MSIGATLRIGAALTFYMVLILAFWPLTMSRNLIELLKIGAFVIVASVLIGFLLRELLKVSVSSEGIGKKPRPMFWSEINEVEHEEIMWCVKGFHVQATCRPTVVVVDSIAKSLAFRDAVDRHSPEDCPIWEVIGGRADRL